MTSADLPHSDLASAAWAGELELLAPATRRDPKRLDELLSDDFVEFGQSGRSFTKTAIVRALIDTDEADVDASAVRADDRSARILGPDSVLLTYVLDFGGRHSRRSSVWVRCDAQVKCLFHQGTTIPEE